MPVKPSLPRSAGARLAVAAAGLLGLSALLYLAAFLYAGTQVPRGTTVSGVDIGGMSPKSAAAKLDRDLGERSRRPMTLRAGSRSATLDPRQAGLSLDSRATVDAAMRGRHTVPALVESMTGGRDVEPRVRVDRARLDAAVTRLGKIFGRPAREGRVVFEGTTPVAVPPRDGTGVDPSLAAQRVRSAFPSRTEVELPHGPLRPRTTEATVRQAAAGPARTAVSAPIVISAEGERVSVAPAAFAPHLTFRADARGGLQPDFDTGRLVAALGPRLRTLQRPARDATYTVRNGVPRLSPSRDGKRIDLRALDAALPAATTGHRPREVAARLVPARPRVTTEAARRLGIRERISTFTTRFPCCAPRVRNIQTISRILDGRIVRPGETFSLNGTVGRRDRARGFVEAPMILNGRFVNDVGGGVSQFTTTMFNAVFFGGLEDVQHTPHSFHISRYPAGRESTVSYPQPDFRWRNDSPYGVLIDTSFTGTSVTVTFWSTRRYEIRSQSSARYAVRGFESRTESGPGCIPMPGAEGFKIDVWRIFKRDGKVVRRQKFHTTYLPEPRVTCGG
ncbi:VanW family protein [Actinomadura kijaniata]|uniref:Vancomycin resistance protein YoaR n=1 Tax=Actinomadura namibiensis TaxID=182080 RepID=A0A7W3QSH2_ACTNM|nr:VanW family protein [Actinomadura namibiensis]MBA8957388.1 vancomycin resistance protein YoaR [Actinomadura namibiensis]